MLLDDLSVLDPEVIADPYSWFAHLRSTDPVHWSVRDGAWVLTRHEDVRAAFRDERLSSERYGPLEDSMTAAQREGMHLTLEILRGWMAFRDPPVHTRLRAPMKRKLTPKRVEELREGVEGIVDSLLDDVEGADEFDLIKRFAFPLPAIVIAQLLGVPPEDRNMFKTWTAKLATLVVGTDHPDLYERARDAGVEFTDYFTELIKRYEIEPANNLISALLEARDEGLGLSDSEMVGACTLLLFGGHETTANLIANSTVVLLQHPDQLELFLSDTEVHSTAIEEFLRMVGPAKIMERRVAEDLRLGGKLLRQGDHVYLAIAAANRDPSIFAEPDQLDLRRDPNPHISFGYGIHYCVGAHLARLEASIALPRLFERFPTLTIGVDELEYTPVVLGRSLRKLPLQVA